MDRGKRKKTGLVTAALFIMLLFCACSADKSEDAQAPSPLLSPAPGTTTPEVTDGREDSDGKEPDRDEAPVREETSALPVVNISCDNGYRSAYLYGYNECLISFEGTDYYGNSMDSGELGASIKLRGNSTIGRPKKSFRLKLDEKEDLFGMGKSRHWVLLANDIDHTQMRNILLNKFAFDIGAEFSIDSVSVDLYFNGEYVGVYQLCEHVRLAKNRIDITDWEDIAEDAAGLIGQAEGFDDERIAELEDALCADYTWIDEPYELEFDGMVYRIDDYVDIPDANGGFLLEMDFYAFDDQFISKLVSAFNLPLYFNTPEPSNVVSFQRTSLYTYAKSFMQSFEYALHSDDFFFRNSDTHLKLADKGRWSRSQGRWAYASYREADYTDDENDGKHYSEFFDMDSLVENFIFCEYAMNWDSMKNSFFVYKDVDSLAHIGPQWDFDWCWGNNNMYGINTYFPESWHTTNEYFTNEQYYQTQQYNRLLIRDPYFLIRAYEKYKEIRPTIIEDMIKPGGEIDSYADYLSESAKKNDEVWKSTYRDYGGQTFDAAVHSMKTFITTRVDWLDRQFADFDTFVDSLGYYVRSRSIRFEDNVYNDDGSVTVTALISNDAGEVVFQLNGTKLFKVLVEDGRASLDIPAELLDPWHTDIVNVIETDDDGNYRHDTSYDGNNGVNLVVNNYKTI